MKRGFSGLLLLSLCSLSLFGQSAKAEEAAAAGATSAKLSIIQVEVPADGKVQDCKISLNEIANYNGTDPGKRYICAFLTQDSGELTPSELMELVKAKQVRFEFANKSADLLAKTLAGWKGFLVADKAEYTAATQEKYIAEVAPFELSVVSNAADISVVNLVNTLTNEAVTFEVMMK